MKIPSNFTRAAVRLDRALFRAVFGVKWEPLDIAMRLFTLAGTAGAMWGFVAFAAFVATGFGAWSLILPWTAVAASWLVAEGSKFFFDRARPFIYDAGISPLIKTPSSSSFPSGHSATAASGAITLAFLYPNFAVPLVFAGFLVMLSRVYLGVHYPFDVFAGAAIGASVAALGIVAHP